MDSASIFFHTAAAQPEHPELHEIQQLWEDLYRIGLVSSGGADDVCGSVSIREDEGFVVGGAQHMGWCRVKPSDTLGFWTEGEKSPVEEYVLHASAYAGATEAKCVAVLRHSGLYGQLLQGKAPAAEEGSGGMAAEGVELERVASRRREDGIIVMKGIPEVFVMYAPNVSHLRDLLYMLGQGYIPM